MPQTTLEFPIAELRGRVDDARKRSDRAPADLYPLLAVELEELADESFLRRSAGSPDAGITWEPLTARTLELKREAGWPAAIGVADGTLLESLQSQATPDGVEARFAANFAGLFDARRTLLPEALPDGWEQQLSRIAEDWYDDVLTFD